MLYLGPGALAVMLLLAQTLMCPPGSDGLPAPASPSIAPAASVELSLHDGRLAALSGGLELGAWELPEAKPYRIVTPGPLAVVTTCNEDLEVTTIVASPTPASFPNMLPMLVEPLYAVLAELAIPDTALNGKTYLVNTEGEVVWSCQEGMLLRPSAGALPAKMFMFADTPGSTPMSPMGGKPELVLVDAQTGEELWRTSLATNYSPLDAQLLVADNGRGLLLLQYGYVNYGFVALDLQSGEALQSWQLAGQVASQMVYPGGFSRLAQLELDKQVVNLLVSNLGEAFELWSFDLRSLTLEKTPADPPQFYHDENDLSQGGMAIPGPPDPPFPQGILPTQFGAEWTIPALLDSEGRLLVVNGDEAFWLAYH